MRKDDIIMHTYLRSRCVLYNNNEQIHTINLLESWVYPAVCVTFKRDIHYQILQWCTAPYSRVRCHIIVL